MTSASALRVVGRFLVLLCSSVAAFMVAEGLARVFFPGWAPRTAALSMFWQYDPRYGWSHLPRTHGHFTAEEGRETSVAINAKGFRGPDREYSRNDSSRRVIVLGDSMAFGFGVDYDDTFGKQLERLMPGLEVINLGVSGYSTDQELLLYRDEGYKYQADLVLVVVAANDLASNARTLEYLIYGKPAFIVRGEDLLLINQPVGRVSWVRRHAVQVAWRSYVLTEVQRLIYRLGERRTLAVQSQTRQGSVGKADTTQTFLRSTTWQLTTRLLREFKRDATRHGSRLLVVFVDGVHLSKEAENYLREFDVDSIVLDEYLDIRDTAFHLADGIHWNPAGHDVVARVLSRKLTAEYLK